MDSSDQDSFDKARFATVLRNLKRGSIPPLASAVRYSGHPSTAIIDDVWFDPSISQALREQIRIRSLHGIAEAMVQLNTLTFSQGGSLLFNAKGEAVGIGSSNIVDLETQYANMRSADYDNTMAFCQTGPFSDPESYLLSLVDAREGKRERGIVEQGAYKLLRIFVEASLMDTSAVNGKQSVERKPFVLAHPDLDSQNILVNNDGSLAGIIDWDWIAAVPHCIGPQSLPKFLTQDYDPANYAYDIEAGEPKEGYAADSPGELACYRALYAQFMESYVSKEDRVNSAKSSQHAARVRKSRKEAANITRRSLIITSLHLAAIAPSAMKKLMVHLFDEIEELTAVEWQEEPSTADSGEQDDSEEGGNKGGDTEASEEDNSDVVKGGSYIQDAVSNARVVSIEHLSIDELVDEIEKLVGISSASNSNPDITQDSKDLQDASPAGETTPEPRVEAQDLSTIDHTKEARQPRAARVCGWIKRKLRRGAKRLHKKPEHDDSIAASAPTSRPARAARTLCGWTEKQLRRMAHCLHCDDDDKDVITVESKIEAVRNGGIDVLKGLRTKFKQLKQKTRRKEDNQSETSEGSEEDVLHDKQVTSISRQLTRAEKRSVCGRFTQMAKDANINLTVDQQVAVAHWMIEALQNPDFSDTSLGNTRGSPHRKAGRYESDAYEGEGDSGNDSGYDEGHGTSADSREKNVDNGETGGQDAGEKGSEPMDPAHMQQPSLSQVSGERTASGEEESSDVSQVTVDSKAKMPTQEDTGAFDLLGVCIALAKDDLDERRMKRLRDGFFGLLNQTM
ncbi:MAG: hypothetical protein Q9161_004171 [Pseudevernia consocians]